MLSLPIYSPQLFPLKEKEKQTITTRVSEMHPRNVGVLHSVSFAVLLNMRSRSLYFPSTTVKGVGLCVSLYTFK